MWTFRTGCFPSASGPSGLHFMCFECYLLGSSYESKLAKNKKDNKAQQYSGPEIKNLTIFSCRQLYLALSRVQALDSQHFVLEIVTCVYYEIGVEIFVSTTPRAVFYISLYFPQPDTQSSALKRNSETSSRFFDRMNSLGKDVIALQVRANFHTTFLKITSPTKELLSLLSGLGPGRYRVSHGPPMPRLPSSTFI